MTGTGRQGGSRGGSFSSSNGHSGTDGTKSGDVLKRKALEFSERYS